MVAQKKVIFVSLILIALIAFPAYAFTTPPSQPSVRPDQTTSLNGRWRVKFTLSAGGNKNLVFESKAGGTGSFMLLDTGVDDKPVPTPMAALWSQLTNDRVSFSSEVELPIGTCCREIGTLTFKGKFDSANSISGKLVFVTSVDEDESPNKFRSLVGTFTATRIVNDARSGTADKD